MRSREPFPQSRLNRIFGFLLGVIAGMPQYVWSQHHNYHHAHNGNWDKYRGPYTTLSVDEYAALSPGQQRLYRYKCSIAGAPLAGFIYLIFNPRFTWLKGRLGLLWHVSAGEARATRRADLKTLAPLHDAVLEIAAGISAHGLEQRVLLERLGADVLRRAARRCSSRST